MVLYVGAADGYHTNYLAKLFPKLQFELWDPRKFKAIETENVKIYRKYFTDKDAKEYAKNGKKILLICDIRNLDFGKAIKKSCGDDEKAEKIVGDDMKFQSDWTKIIKPVYASLKFRLPWCPGKSKYLDGTIYLQPYSPMGTEARLFTNTYHDIEYINEDYDQRMAYFNHYTRLTKKYPEWEKVMAKHKLKNCWDTGLPLYMCEF